jgi:hypothetical protein
MKNGYIDSIALQQCIVESDPLCEITMDDIGTINNIVSFLMIITETEMRKRQIGRFRTIFHLHYRYNSGLYPKDTHYEALLGNSTINDNE